MTNKDTSLINRPIPGITWRVIALIIVVVSTTVLLYAKLQNVGQNALDETIKNGQTLMEIKQDNKEYRAINELRINHIEIEQAELKVRLEILENRFKIK